MAKLRRMLPSPRLPRRSIAFATTGVALFAIAATLIFRFCASSKISAIGDDSVSYLVLAQHFAPATGPTEAWVGYQAHFGPLFALVLAIAGGHQNLFNAHLVVAAFATVSLLLTFVYARVLLSSTAAATAVAVLFFLMSTFWTSIRGILSESLFLALSLGTLITYERWMKSRAWPAAIAVGVLLGASCLTRSAGFALCVALLISAIGPWRRLSGNSTLPQHMAMLFLAFGMMFVWSALKPASEGFTYRDQASAIFRDLGGQPVSYLAACLELTWHAWIRSFVSDRAAYAPAEFIFAVVGVLALIVALRRALQGALDGWYALVGVGVVFVWRFPDDNGRRLLYPLVPLVLIYAAQAVRGLRLAGRLVRLTGPARLMAAVLLAILCIPAWLLIQSRSRDSTIIGADFAYSLRDMTEYYVSVSESAARGSATSEATVLSGLERVGRVTESGAKVMWVRPDYVAFLARRRAVPWKFGWTERRYLEEIESQSVEYIIMSSLGKADMSGFVGAPPATYESARRYAEPVFRERNVLTGDYEFALLKVNHVAVRAALDEP